MNHVFLLEKMRAIWAGYSYQWLILPSSVLPPWKKSYDKSRQCIKKQRHHIANKCLYKAMVFPLVIYGCESWTIKKAKHRRINAFELWCRRRLLRVPWTAKEIQPVHPKADRSWVFTGRTDVEAETPILWPPDAKSWHIGKDPDAGQDWGQEEKGTTEDEMVGWHHRLNGQEFG